MAQNITLLGASYTAVPAVTLPKTGGGTAKFSDASVTTAVASDVAEGKIFLLADGTQATGTASGGGSSTRTTIVPEQTINVSTAYNQITNYNSLFVEGEEYICTVNGVEYTKTAESEYGSVNIHIDGWDIYFEKTASDNMFFDVENSAKYGTYTIKVEQASGGGSSAASSWTKVAETTYQVSTTGTSIATVATWATGHSEIWTDSKWVYVRIRDTAGKRAGYFYGSDQLFVAYPTTATSTTLAARFSLMYTSSGAYGATISSYGVYADALYSDGSIRIRKRYHSSNSLTIDGTYKVEVYLLDPPSGAPIFT